MKINVDTKSIDKFSVNLSKYKDKIQENIRKAIQKSSLSVKKGAMENLTANGNVKTGHLRRSIAYRTTMTQGVIHTSNVKYARGIEEGFKPHLIKAKNKKALYWKGAKHPVKVVRHPGYKGSPYLRPAFENEKTNFIENLREAVKYKG